MKREKWGLIQANTLSPTVKTWLLFLIGGAVNALWTYGVYLLLCRCLNYQVAYFISYVLGIIFAYVFDAVIVFRVSLSWRGSLVYPWVYAVQYGTSALLLEMIVSGGILSEKLAPLLVMPIIFPLTYLMSKGVLTWVHSLRKIR